MNPGIFLLWVGVIAAAIVVLGLAVALALTLIRSVPQRAPKPSAPIVKKETR